MIVFTLGFKIFALAVFMHVQTSNGGAKNVVSTYFVKPLISSREEQAK